MSYSKQVESNYIIVATSGGDYSTLGAAYTACGASRYYVRPGSYAETAQITVPNGSYTYFEQWPALTLTYQVEFGAGSCTWEGKVNLAGRGSVNVNRLISLTSSAQLDASNCQIKLTPDISVGDLGRVTHVSLSGNKQLIGNIILDGHTNTGAVTSTTSAVILTDTLTDSVIGVYIRDVAYSSASNTQHVYGLYIGNTSHNNRFDVSVINFKETGSVKTGYAITTDTSNNNRISGVSADNDNDYTNVGGTGNNTAALS